MDSNHMVDEPTWQGGELSNQKNHMWALARIRTEEKIKEKLAFQSQDFPLKSLSRHRPRLSFLSIPAVKQTELSIHF